MCSETSREWRFFLSDMIEFCEKVLAYTASCAREDFIHSDLIYDATLRNLELIGEAAAHIPRSVRDENAEIPWRKIIATRNRLIHGYLGVDNDVLWSVIQVELPELVPKLKELRRNFSF